MSSEDNPKFLELLERTQRLVQEAESPALKAMRSVMETAERLRETVEMSPGVRSVVEGMTALAQRAQAVTESPGVKAALDRINALAESPAVQAIVEQNKRLEKLASLPTDRITASLPTVDHFDRQPASTQPALHARAVPTVVPREGETKRQAQLHRQRIFVALVQTRALFHDCQRVMKLEAGQRYTALAPNLVLAAFEVPIDEIDDDVGLHAEAFVRVAVGGASQ